MRDLPDMYALGHLPDMYAQSLRAYISGKSLTFKLQLLRNTSIAIVTIPVGWIPQVIVTLVCEVTKTNC